MSRTTAPTRDDFGWFDHISTRWHDNDIYGHVNNVTYYSFFDTAVNRYLIEHGGLDIHNGSVIAFVVNSHCEYFAPLAYPQQLDIGLAIRRLGNSSVTYSLGVFQQGESVCAARGDFVHVFVDRASNSPVPIPDGIRQSLSALLIEE